MPIQKFKYGQEITSAKLNEIVTFVNNLEGYLNNAQYWTDNIDSKISGFQNQLTSILNQVNDLLKTSDSFDTLLSSYLNLKSLYEALVAENVETLLEQLLSPSNLSVDASGNVILNGIETDIQVASIVGPQGPIGANGLNGTNGLNGNSILTGPSSPLGSLGVNNDLYLNTTTFQILKKESGNWVIKGSLLGPRGFTGSSGISTFIEFRYRTNLSDSPTPQPSASTKFLEFRTYLSSDTNDERQARPWIVLKTRGDNWYPVITEGLNNQILLSWSTEEPSEINPINIRGLQGLQGPTGASGNNFIVKGIVSSDANLPLSGVAGDAYMVGASAPYTVYIWNLNKAGGAGWSSIGTGIVGPTGATGPAGTTGQNGATGQRGSKTFVVADDSSFPTATPWNSTALIIGDIFLSETSGLMKQVNSISPFTLEEVYKLPYENQLVFRPKVTEAVNKGDVLQYAGVDGGVKLAKKAVPSEINTNPEYILGVAKTTVTINSFVETVAFGEITGITGFTAGNILYFNSTSASNGLMTATKPTGDLVAKIVIATYVGGSQNLLQVKVGTAHLYNDLIGIQAALDSKATFNNPTFTGTVSGITKGMVGLGNVDNISDANKPVSTATQTALNLKANLNAPTFTGTVGGITKSMVGLANVDNTTDANKPVSTAQQTALNLKANLNAPTFTGTVGGLKTLLWSGTLTVQDNLEGLTFDEIGNNYAFGNNQRFYVVWSFDNTSVFYESYFTSLTLNSTTPILYLNAFGWDDSTSRMEFKSVRMTLDFNALGAVEGLNFRYPKKWHLDGSLTNSDDIVNSTAYIRAVYRINY